MVNNAGSAQQDSSSSSTEQQQQQQPPPAIPPSFGHFIPGPLFGHPPHPTAATTADELPPTPPRTPILRPIPANGDTIPQALRPLDYYFGPHLNSDLKRRRAVHEYMLCRMTQDLTAVYLQRALLALLLLTPLPPPPPPSAPLSSLLVSSSSPPETLLTALLVRELASLLEREAALRAAAARIARTMWSLGLSGLTVARADAFVRGTPPSSDESRPSRRSLAERFRAVYGASYQDYRRFGYHPATFQRNRSQADWWGYQLGLNEFEIGS